jgi:hypothetical protein
MIHLMGLAKALGIGDVTQLTANITRTQGYFWGLATALFLISAILFYLNNDIWWLIAILAVINSQWLIFQAWEDAKFGTLANILILAGIIYGFSAWSFERETSNVKSAKISSATNPSAPVADSDLRSLPPLVQQWLHFSNVIGKSPNPIVNLKQTGRMKLSPDDEWIPFNAEQWFTADPPAFLWTANVGTSLMNFRGRDVFSGGKGSMQIKLYGIFNIVQESGDKIDQASMIRFISETIWLPWTATAEYLQWEDLGNNRVKVSMHWGDTGAFGVFTFDEMGRPISFEAKRYYSRNGDSSLENWMITIDPESYDSFDGIVIPTRATVAWELETGLFQWLELNISEYSVE